MRLITIFWITVCISCHGQEPTKEIPVGGPCEGCEAIYEYGNKSLTNRDTLPDYEHSGKKIIIRGTVYMADGHTPASDVLIYIYHTDENGIYPVLKSSAGWEKRHGYLRGWAKTNKDGKFTFFTHRPAPYPGRTEPAHIHVTVKEPGFKEYYLDSYHFTDDPLMTTDRIEQLSDYGGSGLVTPVQEGKHMVLNRDLFLGKNIIDYPK